MNLTENISILEIKGKLIGFPNTGSPIPWLYIDHELFDQDINTRYFICFCIMQV